MIKPTPKRGRPAIYPWDRWFKRGSWTLSHGKDFQCDPYIMALQCRKQAAKRNVRVSIKITGTKMEVEVKSA